MKNVMMRMSKVVNRKEVRNVLKCISSTLARSTVIIAVYDTKISKELARALNISTRNAQRVLTAL